MFEKDRDRDVRYSILINDLAIEISSFEISSENYRGVSKRP